MVPSRTPQDFPHYFHLEAKRIIIGYQNKACGAKRRPGARRAHKSSNLTTMHLAQLTRKPRLRVTAVRV